MHNKEAIEIIGANIQTYGHFECYQIPYENGKPIRNESDVTLDNFLNLLHEYYNSGRLNEDYGEDAKEWNSIKRFIKKKVNNLSYDIGKEWVDNQKFKTQ